MKKKKRVLVIDDEEIPRGYFKSLLGDEGYTVITAEDGDEGLRLFTQEIFDLVLLDLQLPGSMDGMQVLRRLKIMQPDVVVVMISGHGTADIAVQAVKTGAEDFISKPFPRPAEILLRIEKVLEHQKIVRENAILQGQLALQLENSAMIGTSAKIQEALDLIRRVAPSDISILLTGENGTGKELAAREIYKNSRRAGKKFLRVNCGAFPQEILETILFGCVPNAPFTSAPPQGCKGLFEEADGGTLLLDEIAEASPSFQVKLLRVLQEGEFQRVGGHETLYCDVRIICATNKDLSRAVEDGKFREDLHYRINAVTIKLPPLRERKEDIPVLAHSFLKKFVEKEKKKVIGISTEAMKLMMDFHWPGNVRQLENIIRRGVALCEGDTIDVSCLPDEIRATRHYEIDNTDIFTQTYKKAKETFEKSYLEDLLKACNGDKKMMARISGLDLTTIFRKLRKYNIEVAGNGNRIRNHELADRENESLY
ncbi:MAG: sigma-54 dependent transcriptional regulator [bacterium]